MHASASQHIKYVRSCVPTPPGPAKKATRAGLGWPNVVLMLNESCTIYRPSVLHRSAAPSLSDISSSRFLSDLPCIGRSSRVVVLAKLRLNAVFSTIYAPNSQLATLQITSSELFTRLSCILCTCSICFHLQALSNSPRCAAACIVYCNADRDPVRGGGS